MHDDSTYSNINLIGGRPIEETLKDAYILTSDAANRLPYTEETLTDLEVYEKPQSAATTITNVDFNNFTADIYDQFGEKMNVDATFEIEGTSARIEDGKIIEDVVDNDTSYFIVAKYGNLEARQERTAYAPREVEPSEMDIFKNEIEELKQTIDIMLGGEDNE